MVLKPSSMINQILQSLWCQTCHVIQPAVNRRLNGPLVKPFIRKILTYVLFISFFVFWFWPTKLRKYYVICLYTFFKSLTCLALQMETMVIKENHATKVTKKRSYQNETKQTLLTKMFFMLKVSKSQKQITVSSILPENERNSLA